MAQISKRRFLQAATMAAPILVMDRALNTGAWAAEKSEGRTLQDLASDEDYWSHIARAYSLDGRYIVLNGGGNNPIPTDVTDALHRYDLMAASQPRPYNYTILHQREEHRASLAALFGCKPDEMAITRNTTEGLNIVLHGLDLQPGDEIVYSQYEDRYAGAMVTQLAARRGVVPKLIDLPLRPTPQQVVDGYRSQITDRTRLFVASHLVDGWGFVLPVKELSALAHENGAQMLVDGALSFGQMQIDVSDIGCDYYATSLHKWLNAPLGTGALYVNQDRLNALWPLYASSRQASDIRKFEDIGTRCGPTVAAIGQAIRFYEQIGPARKEARVRYLLGIVMKELDGHKGVAVITERDEAKRTGLARISVEGFTGRELAKKLLDDHDIYTYGNFPGPYDGVYISPNLFNSARGMYRFSQAIKQIAS